MIYVGRDGPQLIGPRKESKYRDKLDGFLALQGLGLNMVCR